MADGCRRAERVGLVLAAVGVARLVVLLSVLPSETALRGGEGDGALMVGLVVDTLDGGRSGVVVVVGAGFPFC
jgi:hypothetical protein